MASGAGEFLQSRVERSASGGGYTAYRYEERAAPNFLSAPTLGELEAALMEQANR